MESSDSPLLLEEEGARGVGCEPEGRGALAAAGGESGTTVTALPGEGVGAAASALAFSRLALACS